MEKPLKVRLHILSPLHIGCDDVYEPTSFVIDEKKGKLIDFDAMEFIKALSAQDRKKFTDICSQGNITSIISIYKFLSNREISGRDVDVVAELISHYKKVRELPTNNEGKIKQELNQFAISRTAYNSHNNLPYIPGSSIKGSLRTAYLSQLAADKKITDRRDNAKNLEIELLGGSFDRDPFRMVRVSDFLPVEEVKTRIVYAINKKKKTSNYEAMGPFQILETVKQGTIFEGIINIESPEKTAGITTPIKIETLLDSVNKFYNRTFEQEEEILKKLGVGLVKRDAFAHPSTIVRLGRHSGAEAVTIEGNRSIKIMQRRGDQPKFLDHATTIWLASEKSKPKPEDNSMLLPFGWASLETVPFDIKNIYPVPVSVTEPPKTKTENIATKKESIPIPKTIQSQTIFWENATLTWSPNNQVLKSTKDNHKAELKVSDRSIVPAEHHDKLFVKRKSVTANVTVEKIGNEFKIIKIS